jgi:hypothetical protein
VCSNTARLMLVAAQGARSVSRRAVYPAKLEGSYASRAVSTIVRAKLQCSTPVALGMSHGATGNPPDAPPTVEARHSHRESHHTMAMLRV